MCEQRADGLRRRLRSAGAAGSCRVFRTGAALRCLQVVGPPVLADQRAPRDRSIFWRTTQHRQEGAVRQGAWKYLRDEAGEYLFDLALDPGEREDRQSDEPARTADHLPVS